MAKKILVVDDSASIRQLVNFALKQGANAGKYEVIEAVDGIEGVAALKNHKFDLIFTELLRKAPSFMEGMKAILSQIILDKSYLVKYDD